MDNIIRMENAAQTEANVLPSKRHGEEAKLLRKKLSELLWLEKLLRRGRDHLSYQVEYTAKWQSLELPVYSITLGQTENPRTSLLLTAGVHGVERIGTQVLLTWFESLLERLRWDQHLVAALQDVQLVLMPLVNPVGMFNNWRSNGNGVDLNRNAPIEAEDKTPWMLGGQRLSPRLPWYRGERSSSMEGEALAIENVLQRQIIRGEFGMALDLHSGFGFHDYLWVPYAYRKKPISTIADYVALKLLWERCYPQTDYIFEPQSLHYLANGDLWDYFFKKVTKESACHFMPITLEMGSWNWIKKRPQQLLSFTGLFNPVLTHRYNRVLRRHMLLLEFCLSAAMNHQQWLPPVDEAANLRHLANDLWFKSRKN